MSITSIGSSVNSSNYSMYSYNSAAIEINGVKNGTDKVSISDGAVKANLQSLSDFLGSRFMDGAGEDGVITLEEIRAFRDKNMEQARNIISNILNDLNIKNYGKLHIDIDNNGSVNVTGSTEENNNAITEALQKDDRFINTWNACSADSSLIAAAEAAMPFHDAYKADPKAAVAEYGWLIGKDWDFDMYFENGKIEYSVV